MDKAVKPSGRRIIYDLVYIVMEFVQGSLHFDLDQTRGAMSDDAGRFFLRQLLDPIDYKYSRRVFHRDLRPEKILIDNGQ